MTATISEYASNHLKLLSAISAVFVVFIHATTVKYDAALDWDSLAGQIQGILSHDIFHVALAIFFLNAAFFLCHGVEKSAHIWKRLKQRRKTLVMPYLVWSGFWVVVALFWGLLSEVSIVDIAVTWLVYPLPGQLWFLRDLIALALFAPLVFLLSRSALAITSLLAWMWWLWDQTVVTLDLRTHWYELISNEALCWFLVGMLVARCAQQLLNIIETGIPAYLLTFLFVIWISGSWLSFPGEIAHGLSVSAGVLFLLGASQYLHRSAESRWTTIIAGYGFLIYAGHHPLIGLVQGWLLRDASGNQIWHLTVYLLTPLTIIVAIILTFFAISKVAPMIVYAANGGRPLPEINTKPENYSL